MSIRWTCPNCDAQFDGIPDEAGGFEEIIPTMPRPVGPYKRFLTEDFGLSGEEADAQIEEDRRDRSIPWGDLD